MAHALIASLLAAFALTQSSSAGVLTDQFVDSAGVAIRYVERGSGPPVVLLHGYTGTLDRHFVANGVFDALAASHRAIAMDLRGHGKSGKPHAPLAYGNEMARDVVRLLDHLKVERAHVLGYSLGAMIAGRLATLHPERLMSIAYVGSLPVRTTDSYMAKFAADSAAELESDLPFKSLMINLQSPASDPPSTEEIRKAVAPLVAANDVKALAALWRGFHALMVAPEHLKAVPVPSVVIIGSDDIGAAGIPELNRTQPQIRTVVVSGAQHGGPQGVMRRTEFLTALQEFFASAKVTTGAAVRPRR